MNQQGKENLPGVTLSITGGQIIQDPDGQGNGYRIITTTGSSDSAPAFSGEGETILWAIEPGALPRVIEDAKIVQADGEVRRASYYEITDDGIAIFSMMGPIGRRMSGFSRWLFDGVDSDAIGAELLDAARNPAVKAILLHIDSPGGTVAGTKELRDIVASIEKPTIAFTDGRMTSAAYWIGSAADKIIGTTTALFGSIGVLATHVDRSRMLERAGLKVTHIYNGAFKAVGVDTEPLSEEGRKYIQEQVDTIYSIFVGDVAPARRMSPDAVRDLQSAVFVAEQAKERGLVDGIMSLVQAYTLSKRGVGIMDMNELKKDFRSLYDEAVEIGKSSVTKEEVSARFPEIADNARTEGEQTGAQNERTRISEIREAAFKGQEELAEKLIGDGVSADEARKQLIADQKKRAKDGINQMVKQDTGSMGDNLAGDGAGGGGNEITAKDKREAGDKLTEIAQAKMKAEGIPFGKAFAAACADHPNLAKMYEGK